MREGSREWAWAQTVWDYLLMRQPLEPCDGVLCLCSHDTRVAEHAASCFLRGTGKWLLFSGGHGTGPHSGRNLHGWTDPEADIFARIAIDMGVPESHIFVENRSANSGENIRFSQALLEEKEQHPTSILVVQKPFMERRAWATFEKQWQEPRPTIFLTSPDISFKDYPMEGLSREAIVNVMVGDLQRIREYTIPPREYQIPQTIPDDVWRAYENLVTAGFTWNLIQ